MQPVSQSVPSKSKDFSYTSIKLSSELTGDFNETNLLNSLAGAQTQSSDGSKFKLPDYSKWDKKNILDSIYEKYGFKKGNKTEDGNMTQMELPENNVNDIAAAVPPVSPFVTESTTSEE